MNQWASKGVDWVTRLRSNNVYKVTQDLSISEKETAHGIVSDQLIVLGFENTKIERVPCRLVCYYDADKNREFQFITSNKRWAPSKVAMLYKRRWQIETLFKRLKQNMPLEYFLGDNENAIKIQIFCSLIADLLLRVVTTKVKRRWSFSNLASFVRLHLMNYTHVYRFLENPERCGIYNPPPDIQLKLSWSG
jgi:transposase